MRNISFRGLFLALALIALTPIAAFAHNNDNNGSSSFGELSGFVGFGTFATQGGTGAVSVGNGIAESFSDHSAGVTFNRCDTCGGAQFSGFTNNASGAQSEGNAASWGSGNGAASGFGAGGFISGFTGHTGGRR